MLDKTTKEAKSKGNKSSLIKKAKGILKEWPERVLGEKDSFYLADTQGKELKWQTN